MVFVKLAKILMINSPTLPRLVLATAAALAFALAGCETTSGPSGNYAGNGAYTGPTPSSSAVINQAVLDRTNPSNARIEISLGEQKARLFCGNELAIETRISTGREGSHTPRGSHQVLEKLRTKDSTLYGSWIDSDSGRMLQGDGDSRSRPAGGNATFQGSPMPYWLRITRDGVGMHVGHVAGRPVSHGCIRVPNKIQPMIWERVGVGTPVIIR